MQIQKKLVNWKFTENDTTRGVGADCVNLYKGELL